MKTNVILIGMPGCGKTSIGELLAKELSYEFCDLDEHIVEKESMTIDKMFEKGEIHFRDIETSAVKDISKMKDTVIATGGGVVTRPENIKILRENGFIIFIDRPVEDIISDVDIDSRPLLKDGKKELYKLFDERYKLYQDSCHIEVINDKGIEKLIENIMGLLK